MRDDEGFAGLPEQLQPSNLPTGDTVVVGPRGTPQLPTHDPLQPTTADARASLRAMAIKIAGDARFWHGDDLSTATVNRIEAGLCEAYQLGITVKGECCDLCGEIMGDACCLKCRDAHAEAVQAQAEARITALEADLARWKICENCGEPLTGPGICDKAVSESQKNLEAMLEETLTRAEKAEAERDMLREDKARVREQAAQLIERRLESWRQGVGNLGTLAAAIRAAGSEEPR